LGDRRTVSLLLRRGEEKKDPRFPFVTAAPHFDEKRALLGKKIIELPCYFFLFFRFFD